MKRNIYKEITNTILESLEQGTVPWQRPWHSTGLPTNARTGKEYRGINIWLLSIAATTRGFSSNEWCSYKQAKALGGNVRKGEKGTAIIFWKMLQSKDKAGEKTSFPMIRMYTTFNVDQCDGITPKQSEQEASTAAPDVQAEALVNDYLRTGPRLERNPSQAFYSPERDLVSLPSLDAFANTRGYYSTLLHEMGHSTGHVTRLDREGITNPTLFGDHLYSKEELIAEMSAAMLCGVCGLEPDYENNAAYIACWVKVLKGDDKLVVSAALKAQKAADCVRGITFDNDTASDGKETSRQVEAAQG